MLNLYFYDYISIFPFFIFFVSFWIFFLKNNFFSVRINPSNSDILKNSKFLKKIHYNFMNNWIFFNFFFLILSIFFLKIDFNVFWFNHLKLNNFLINILILILTVVFFMFNLIRFLKNSNVNYSIDYFSALVNLSIFIPFIFYSNNLYSFLFILELNSLLILYKFTVSRTWFNKLDSNSYFNKNKTFDRLLPKSYLNMIFFQYWTNFFSSMLIMFSIFNIIYIFGSSEWNFLNFINYSVIYNLFIFNHYFILLVWIPFFIGLFFKIGFTPLHLFKIEVYKGIPFLSIFFYTTFYFLSFFLFFIVIIHYYLNSYKIFWSLFLYMFILIGLFYSIILLFDVNLIKAFFAYSTIVNVLTFLIVLYLSIN